jgi:surface protein
MARGPVVNEAFEFTVKTDNAGTSAADQFTIPITSATPYNISTSDGQSITGATGATTLTFPSPGTYTVSITDSCEGLQFNNTGDKLKLLDISNWGVFKSTVERTFYGCSNMTCSAIAPPLNPELTCRYIFAACVNFNGAIGNWDVSSVTDFSFCFNGCSSFDQNISNWNVSSAILMEYMFSYGSFNNGGDPGINNWNTSNLLGNQAMNNMFAFNSSFNQPIGNWDVSGVTNFKEMFRGASSFNQDLNFWNTSNVTNMQQMFDGASAFNGNVSTWDVTKVTSGLAPYRLFASSGFNGDLSSWNVSTWSSLYGVFQSSAFNNNSISNWNVSNVNRFQGTFSGNTVFNQDISGWNTSNANRMDQMFSNADAFNQDLSTWNVSGVTNMASMFQDRGNSPDSNLNISGWTTTSLTNTTAMFKNTGGNTQDLSGWNMSNVDFIQEMFAYGRINFNPSSWNIAPSVMWNTFLFSSSIAGNIDTWNLYGWNITGLTQAQNFLNGQTLSTTNYDATLVAWENQLQTAYPGGVGYTPINSISFGGSKYSLGSAAEAARTSLINTYSWTITDGGGVLTNESYLVASYNFDSNFTDYTGNHPLTATGSVTAGTAGGKVSNCSDFNGTSSDYLTGADSDDFSFTNGSNDLPFSVSMWVNFDSVSDAWFMDKRTAGNDEWQITYYLGKLNMALFSAGASSAYLYGTYTTSLTASTWYHIAFTYDGSGTFAGINFYLNGVNQTLTNESVGTYAGMTNGTAPLRLGTFTSGFPFNGKMDETHIWKNRELTASEVTDIYNTENAGNSILPPDYITNLVASYNFDTNFTDYTGNHPLTATGSVTAGVAGGKVSNCSDFNGTTGYLTAADSDDFSFTNGVNDLPFSISFWFNFDSGASASNFVQKRNASSDFEWQIIGSSSSIFIDCFSNGIAADKLRKRYSATFNNNTWYHFTATYDGSGNNSGLKIYIDGLLTAAANQSTGTYVGMTNFVSNTWIGTEDGITGMLNGQIDELHIWKNKELTAAEVTDIYNTENAGNTILPGPYLLNNYGGAAAAYSLRDLSSSTTNVVRVRRSSDNTEQDFTSTQVTDGTLTTFVGAGNDGFVTVWYDQSGNSRNTIQATPALQPQIVSSGALILVNGLPTVDFNNGPYLETTQSFHAVNDASFALAGLQKSGEIDYGRFASTYFSDGFWLGRYIGNQSISGGWQSAAATPAVALADNTMGLMFLYRSGADSFRSVNGSTPVSQTTNSNVTTARPFIIGESFSKNAPGTKQIYEMVLWDNNQSANQAGIESNINSYYTIY